MIVAIQVLKKHNNLNETAIKINRKVRRGTRKKRNDLIINYLRSLRIKKITTFVRSITKYEMREIKE